MNVKVIFTDNICRIEQTDVFGQNLQIIPFSNTADLVNYILKHNIEVLVEDCHYAE